MYRVSWGDIWRMVEASDVREARGRFIEAESSEHPEIQRFPNKNPFEIEWVEIEPTPEPIETSEGDVDG